MNYPETFDTTGPASLDDAYAYLSWAAVSAHGILAGQPEAGWEQVPDLLGQGWGDPGWYQRNGWLADFYDTVYHHASAFPPVQIFAVDELGEPATEMARVIDSVTQNWIAAAHQAAEQDGYEQAADQDGYDQHGYDQDGQPYDQHDQDGYQQQEHGPDGSAYPTGQPEPGDQVGPADHVEPVGPTPEPLVDLDPEAAREVLDRVVDDEVDDLSVADQRVLATVLTVEKFQYLAREYKLV
ncbi:hypothetical protein B5D80_31510 [Micromonospora wenchangensis]|uniref:Uncharacterized protein n=1 Tax=Micromonospora wenchangensis TaxID=1185415 RepID=A0A246R9P3_9ACTN|nr:hypothetical protein [Micromonospora wenchangensis]OWU97466.1 hypothetical protein B5D80_31510 [Micromonospora wenchangensis]